MTTLSCRDIERLAASHGFSVPGIVAASLALPDEAGKMLTLWLERGYQGSMSYMARAARGIADVRRLFEAAQSIVVLSVDYERGPAPPARAGFGRVARYAWGRDYHRVIRRRLLAFVKAVEAHVGRAVHSRVCCDAIPLLERAYGNAAGLGFLGRNTMLIRPGAGSFFFLAEVLWDLEIEGAAEMAAGGRCGECERCLSACPAGALTGECLLDARKCVSYLTIEKKGELSWQERELLGEWLFGCDLCQEACPHNRAALVDRAPLDFPELGAGHGCGGLLELGMVLGLRTREQFVKRFAGSPLMRAGREGLLRNAAVVAANTAAFHLQEAVVEAAEGDAAAVVRQHALWALFKMSGTCDSSGARSAVERARGDSAAVVRAEASALLERWGQRGWGASMPGLP
jgi:epoxyqueuosine reductase